MAAGGGHTKWRRRRRQWGHWRRCFRGQWPSEISKSCVSSKRVHVCYCCDGKWRICDQCRRHMRCCLEAFMAAAATYDMRSKVCNCCAWRGLRQFPWSSLHALQRVRCNHCCTFHSAEHTHLHSVVLAAAPATTSVSAPTQAAATISSIANNAVRALCILLLQAMLHRAQQRSERKTLVIKSRPVLSRCLLVALRIWGHCITHVARALLLLLQAAITVHPCPHERCCGQKPHRSCADA